MREDSGGAVFFLDVQVIGSSEGVNTAYESFFIVDALFSDDIVAFVRSQPDNFQSGIAQARLAPYLGQFHFTGEDPQHTGQIRAKRKALYFALPFDGTKFLILRGTNAPAGVFADIFHKIIDGDGPTRQYLHHCGTRR